MKKVVFLLIMMFAIQGMANALELDTTNVPLEFSSVDEGYIVPQALYNKGYYERSLEYIAVLEKQFPEDSLGVVLELKAKNLYKIANPPVIVNKEEEREGYIIFWGIVFCVVVLVFIVLWIRGDRVGIIVWGIGAILVLGNFLYLLFDYLTR